MTHLRLKIRNFQALADVALEVKGFTCLTGPSNVGKSAAIRAAAAAIFGWLGDHYVRRGTDQAAVGLYQPGLEIKWRKAAAGKATTTNRTILEVDGQKHSKIGRDHQELTRHLGFQEVKTTDRRIRPQIALQHDLPFLVAESETVIAEVFKRLGRSDQVAKASQSARKDRFTLEGELRLRREDQTKAESTLEELAYVTVLTQSLNETKHRLADYGRAALRYDTQQGQLKWLQVHPPRDIPISPGPLSPPIQVELQRKLIRFQALPLPRLIPPSPTETFSVPQTRVKIDKLRGLMKFQGEIQQRRQQLEKLSLNLALLEERKSTLEGELGTCPTCGQDFPGHAPHG